MPGVALSLSTFPSVSGSILSGEVTFVEYRIQSIVLPGVLQPFVIQGLEESQLLCLIWIIYDLLNLLQKLMIDYVELLQNNTIYAAGDGNLRFDPRLNCMTGVFPWTLAPRAMAKSQCFVQVRMQCRNPFQFCH